MRAELEKKIVEINAEKEVLTQNIASLSSDLQDAQEVKLEIERESEREVERLNLEAQKSIKSLEIFYAEKLVEQNEFAAQETKGQIDELTSSLETTVKHARRRSVMAAANLESLQEKLSSAEHLLEIKLEYVDHDPTILGHMLAETKIELALQKCENEELQQSYRKLELVTCDLKLNIASMQEERDDMIAMKLHVSALLEDPKPFQRR